MTNKLKWMPEAKQDLIHISSYIKEYNPVAAINIMKKIVLSVEERLLKFQNIGRAGRMLGTRELVIPSTPYIAVYWLKDGFIEILRVYHSAKKWPDKF